MLNRIIGVLVLAVFAVAFAGCAANGKTEDASVQANRQIVQDLSKVPQQDLHGVSSEPISGKDITPDRR